VIWGFNTKPNGVKSSDSIFLQTLPSTGGSSDFCLKLPANRRCWHPTYSVITLQRQGRNVIRKKSKGPASIFLLKREANTADPLITRITPVWLALRVSAYLPPRFRAKKLIDFSHASACARAFASGVPPLLLGPALYCVLGDQPSPER